MDTTVFPDMGDVLAILDIHIEGTPSGIVLVSIADAVIVVPEGETIEIGSVACRDDGVANLVRCPVEVSSGPLRYVRAVLGNICAFCPVIIQFRFRIERSGTVCIQFQFQGILPLIQLPHTGLAKEEHIEDRPFLDFIIGQRCGHSDIRYAVGVIDVRHSRDSVSFSERIMAGKFGPHVAGIRIGNPQDLAQERHTDVHIEIGLVRAMAEKPSVAILIRDDS